MLTSKVLSKAKIAFFITLFLAVIVYFPLNNLTLSEPSNEPIDDWNNKLPVNRPILIGKTFGSQTISPQPMVFGKRVVWLTSEDNQIKIILLDLDTGTTKEIPIATSSAKLAQFYKNRIAWLSDFPHPRIYITNVDTGESSAIPQVANGHQYSPSLWGNKLAFIEWPNQGMAQGAKVYLMDFLTRTVDEITSNFTVYRKNPSVALYENKIAWLDTWSPGPIYGFPSILVRDLTTGQTESASTSFKDKYSLKMWSDKIIWIQTEQNPRGSIAPPYQVVYLKNLDTGFEGSVEEPPNILNYWQFMQNNPLYWNDLIVWREQNVYGSDISPISHNIKVKNAALETSTNIFSTIGNNQPITRQTGLYQTAEDEYLLTYEQARDWPGYNKWDVYLMRLTPDYSESSKSASAEIVAPGEEFTYNIHIENSGVIEDENLTITDTLPAGLTFVSASDEDKLTRIGNTLTWNLGAFNPGEEKDLWVRVRADAPLGTIFFNKAVINKGKAYQKALLTRGPVVAEDEEIVFNSDGSADYLDSVQATATNVYSDPLSSFNPFDSLQWAEISYKLKQPADILIEIYRLDRLNKKRIVKRIFINNPPVNEVSYAKWYGLVQFPRLKNKGPLFAPDGIYNISVKAMNGTQELDNEQTQISVKGALK